MNIYMRELKANRKSLLFWCIGMVFLIVSGVGKFEAFSANSQATTQLMDSFPRIIKVVFGLGSFDLGTASGFYGVIYMYIILVATIFAAMLGGTILSKEKQEKTAEFLFVKPVSRSRVLTAKLLAGITNIVILTVITTISSISIVNAVNKGPSFTNEILLLMIGTFLVQLFFFTLAFFISAWSCNGKAGVLFATNTLVVTFFISLFIDMTEKIDFLRWITPFKYFTAEAILNGKGLNVTYIVVCLFFVGGFIVFSYYFFSRRDII